MIYSITLLNTPDTLPCSVLQQVQRAWDMQIICRFFWKDMTLIAIIQEHGTCWNTLIVSVLHSKAVLQRLWRCAIEGLLPSAWSKVLLKASTLHQLFCTCFTCPSHLDHEYFRISPRESPGLNHTPCRKYTGPDNARGTVNL